MGLCPLHSKLLVTEVDTHTRCRFAALRRTTLNRHLKSLRNERRAERAALRGQEKKIGVVKSEYLALDWGRETSLKNHLKSLKESPTNDEKRKKESGGAGMGCMSMCVYMYVFEYLAL